MAEEHGFESHEEHRLCVNNCGFSGSPATQNMCSNCYRSATTMSSSTPMTTPSSKDDAEDPVQLMPITVPSSPRNSLLDDNRLVTQQPAGSHHHQMITSSSTTGRCATCRKKIGLMGFRCRCGTTFCGVHRYPEKHGCAFDYKAVGREFIAKENPIVKGEKLRYKI